MSDGMSYEDRAFIHNRMSEAEAKTAIQSGFDYLSDRELFNLARSEKRYGRIEHYYALFEELKNRHRNEPSTN